MRLRPSGALLAALLVLAPLAGATWPSARLGGTSLAIAAVAIGDGDNDGVAEVYASTGGPDPKVLRFGWNGSAWVKTLVGTASEGLRALAVGDGDNDGTTEVYAPGTDGHIFRFARIGNAWERSRLPFEPANPYRTITIALGDVDIDGRNELYAGEGRFLFRLRNDRGSWASTNVTEFESGITAMVLADQDRDNKSELWIGTDQGWVHRVFKDPLGWNVTEIGFGPVQKAFRGLAIADLNEADLGDGNRTPEVYAVQRNELFYFTLESGTIDPQGHWQRHTPCFTDNCFADASTMNITGLRIGNLTGDGPALYYPSINNHLYELRHTGPDAWGRTDLGATSAMLALDLGEGRGDGEGRAYVGTEQGSVVEFTAP